MKKRFLILGAGGMLGQEFVATLERNAKISVFPCDHHCADINDRKALIGVIKKSRPEVVINCAAKINVDECEREPLKAWMVNAMGPGMIVQSIADAGFTKTLFIHISSSHVFGDDKAVHRAGDPTIPVNVYGWSKLGGEKIVVQTVQSSGIQFFIFRLPWLYSEHRSTFIDFFIDSLTRGKKFSAISDEFSIPVWTRDAARKIIKTCHKRKLPLSGIYHLTSSAKEPKSRYDVACYLAKLLGVNPRLIKKSYRRKVFTVPRAKSARLIPSKGFVLPPWKVSLKSYLRKKYPHLL